ncbi:uncharacterized protein LY89DRAFT_88293 [Mollisia scopiformis]|uniref:Uncharacterized protein n=1 Tax=Mollisia scopiformis TaxID=149040 RepID=A0A194XA31_MOLSC|nr:uncharacterized protein LY89DRAFT_88293 [Mollisia scopiformis]KUJ16622.1 hypothetical protein LY89DRAFT_88293 [Mollisia scopiformis]
MVLHTRRNEDAGESRREQDRRGQESCGRWRKYPDQMQHARQGSEGEAAVAIMGRPAPDGRMWVRREMSSNKISIQSEENSVHWTASQGRQNPRMKPMMVDHDEEFGGERCDFLEMEQGTSEPGMGCTVASERQSNGARWSRLWMMGERGTERDVHAVGRDSTSNTSNPVPVIFRCKCIMMSIIYEWRGRAWVEEG